MSTGDEGEGPGQGAMGAGGADGADGAERADASHPISGEPALVAESPDNVIVRFALQQGVLVNILFFVFLVAGIFAARRVAVDAYPNVDLDAAVVATIWAGASPEEIDNLVTARIEDELEGIRGIDRIISDSRPNRSSVLVKFREDLADDEVDRAFQDIRAALERIDDLPEGTERPILQRQTVFEIFPLVSVAISFDEASRETAARATARDLRERLLALDGIAKVDDRDLRDPEVSILVDRARAESFDLTLAEIADLLAATNRNLPAGEIRAVDGEEFGVKAAGNYRSLPEVEETVIRFDPGGAHVRVRDVARVSSGYEERDVKSRFNGRDAILLPVSKEEGRNSVELVDRVRELVAAYEAQGLSDGLHVGIALDSSQIIRDRIRVLGSNLLTGILFVFLALWAGIGVRNAILAIIGIPFCYLVALLFLGSVGVSVNALSLFAMVLVSGVIVDDALIVLENIYRLLERGLPFREAVLRGASQVFWPVFSSTLTTLAAFLPMLLMVGVTGEFFSIIPKVVVVALLASVFECFVILPIHYIHWGQRVRARGASPAGADAPRPPRFDFVQGLGRRFAALRGPYERLLNACLRHRIATFVCLIAIAIAAAGVAGTLDTLLFPSDFQVFVVNMEMAPGASLQQTSEAAMGVDEVLARMNREGPFAGEIEGWTTSIGVTFTDDNLVLLAPHVAQGFVSLRQGTGVDPLAAKDYASDLLRRIRNEPRDAEERRVGALLARFRKVSAEPQQDGPPTGKPVAVRIRCDDFDEAEGIAARMKAFLATRAGIKDVADNHDEGRVEYSISLRADLAAAQGIPFAAAARTLLIANDGLVVSVFKDPGGIDDADVRVRLAPGDARDVAALSRVRLRNARGDSVPLSSIAAIEAERSHAGIYRYDGRRTVLLTAEIDGATTTATEVNEALRTAFDTEQFRADHPGVGLRFGGEFEETQKSFESLGEAFYVALLAIYMILAAQFRSYALPLVILLTIPFAFIGVVVGLFVTGNPFTITAGIAMIGLAGIAVNDAIVLVDFMNVRRRQGLPLLDAVREGCRLRARPILLTSITTIAGLLPMALGLTGFSKLWSPFAATICFGILFSTVLTLLVIPAAYAMVDDAQRRWAEWRGSRGGGGVP